MSKIILSIKSNLKKHTPRCILIKLLSPRKNFENKRKATQYIQMNPHKLTVDISTEILQVRRERDHYFKVMKEKTANQKYYLQKNDP